jgi:hypothetical protein
MSEKGDALVLDAPVDRNLADPGKPDQHPLRNFVFFFVPVSPGCRNLASRVLAPYLFREH